MRTLNEIAHLLMEISEELMLQAAKSQDEPNCSSTARRLQHEARLVKYCADRTHPLPEPEVVAEVGAQTEAEDEVGC